MPTCQKEDIKCYTETCFCRSCYCYVDG